mgnify:CR=1 FL=1
MHTAITGAFQVLLAGVCWGTYGTIASFLPRSMSSLAVGSLRLGIGAIGIAVVLLASRKGRLLTHIALLPKRQILVAAIALGMAQVTLYLGIRSAGVTVATMIFIGTPPLFSGLYAQVFRNERQTRSWGISSLIIMFGCICMALADNTNQYESNLLTGSLYALAAGAGWTLVGTLLRDMQKSASPLESSFVIMGVSSVVMLPFALLSDRAWATEVRVLPLVIALGLFSSALPYWLFTTGARRIPASHAFLYGLSEPITASLLGLIVLKERLNMLGSIGYLAVVCGLVCFSVWEIRSARSMIGHD